MVISKRNIQNSWFVSLLDKLFITSSAPININYFWNFGSLLGVILIIQIISGICLSFHYVPTTNLAFDSIQYIMIEENLGWLLRYTHSNGASLFFFFVYFHIGRNLHYLSFTIPRTLVWNIGVIIFILMMATAFIGYVLVWGTMSLWGAIVITNFFSVIPWMGIELVYFIWGGFSVDFPTLNRFYGLHYTLPWAILALVFLHILALHYKGSNNPNGIKSNSYFILFHPFFIYKDIITFILLAYILIILIGYYPNILGHPDNYIKANPLVTPASIVPEWYFLPFYAILRSISNKALGVSMMGLSIACLFTLPWFFNHLIRSNNFKPAFAFIYWTFIGNFIILLFLGNLSVEYPYVYLGMICTFYYFSSLTIIPFIISIFQLIFYSINFIFPGLYIIFNYFNIFNFISTTISLFHTNSTLLKKIDINNDQISNSITNPNSISKSKSNSKSKSKSNEDTDIKKSKSNSKSKSKSKSNKDNDNIIKKSKSKKSNRAYNFNNNIFLIKLTDNKVKKFRQSKSNKSNKSTKSNKSNKSTKS